MKQSTCDHPALGANRLRRAFALAAELEQQTPDSTEHERAGIAELLPPRGWVMLADHAGITPPSAATIAMAVELLRLRADELNDDVLAGLPA